MSANVTISVTERDLYKALGDFLRGLFPDVEIERAQQNNNPMPLGDFIVMTPLFSSGLSTSVVNYTRPESAGTGQQHISRTTEWRCQLDFYGDSAESNALLVATVIRSEFACEQFQELGGTITPLHTSDPRQLSIINGEQQWENRWTLDFVAQINPIVTAPQTFFDSVSTHTISTESINGNSN
ncbi:phage neck terminator protein [Xenorhabdus bovienii]|uniref:phage neck terminator protein n=1 Tax=Xenorhabdus bovienii TaxID=40576 RepID=UPI0023B2C587|nr:hypothetical protein [Xenorhabdus bovienii]MDE9552784.1 hypothetical protein [Xenorhabdus bovienii]